MTNLLERELKKYKQIRRDLLQRAPEKFALIHENVLVGTFDSYSDAAREGYSRFGNVPFLVKEILEEEPVLFVGLL
jgi:hypothetical protein